MVLRVRDVFLMEGSSTVCLNIRQGVGSVELEGVPGGRTLHTET